MLSVDTIGGRFLLGGVAIGRGTREADVARRLDGAFSDIPGHPALRHFDGRSGDLALALSFSNGRLESGHFLAALPRAGSWAQREENEAWRRRQHEAIMRSLFGALRYEHRDLIVDLVREPRDLTEQLRFVVPPR